MVIKAHGHAHAAFSGRVGRSCEKERPMGCSTDNTAHEHDDAGFQREDGTSCRKEIPMGFNLAIQCSDGYSIARQGRMEL